MDLKHVKAVLINFFEVSELSPREPNVSENANYNVAYIDQEESPEDISFVILLDLVLLDDF
jgi:hypothetical protein